MAVTGMAGQLGNDYSTSKVLPLGQSGQTINKTYFDLCTCAVEVTFPNFSYPLIQTPIFLHI